MLGMKGFFLSVLCITLLLIAAEGKKKCNKKKFDLKLGSETMFKSPKFDKKKPKLPCNQKTFEYQSPPGSTIELTCNKFNIECKKGKTYLWDSVDKKKRCGKSPFSVVSKSNKLKVKYFSSNKNKNKRNFFYDCIVKVTQKTEPSSICDICGTRSFVPISASLVEERSANLTRIVNGEDAQLKEFPYQVLIYIVTQDGTFQCGGSLVTDQWLITAAHCEVEKERDFVVLGALDVDDLIPEVRLIDVEEAIPHPDYAIDGTDRYDIAVVKLSEKVSFNEYIQPICLPDPFQANDFVGEKLQATGWGALSSGGPLPSTLQKVNLDVITNTECEAAGGIYDGNVFIDSICTLTPGKDACQGDSGGPLSYRPGDKSFLIGVTSYGFGCAFPGQPGVFTRVSDPGILQWVKEKMGITCSVTTS